MSSKSLILLGLFSFLITPFCHAQLQVSHVWSMSDINDTDGWSIRMQEPAFDSQGHMFISGMYKDKLDLDGDGIADLVRNGEDEYNRFFARFDERGSLTEARRLSSFSDVALLVPGRQISIDSEDNIYLIGVNRGDVDVNQDEEIDITLPDTTTQFLAKYSPNFELLWTVPLASPLLSRVQIIHNPQTDGFYIIGASRDPCTPNDDTRFCNVSAFERLIIRSYDKDGASQWEYASSDRLENPDSAVKVQDAAISNNGELYVTATYEGTIDLDGPAGYDPLVAPISPDDATRSFGALWARFDNAGTVSKVHPLCVEFCPRLPFSIAINSTNNLYVSGALSLSNAVDSTVYGHLASFSPDGALIFLKERPLDFLTSFEIWHQDLYVDTQDNLYSTGLFWGDADFDDDGIVDEQAPIHGRAFAVKYMSDGTGEWMHFPTQEFSAYNIAWGNWVRQIDANRLFYGGYFNEGALDVDGPGPTPPLVIRSHWHVQEVFFFYFGASNTSLEEAQKDLPFTSSPAWPNPFKNRASFSLTLSQDQEVSVVLFDLLGRQVQSIFKGHLPRSQPHTFTIDGSQLPSGTYIYQVSGTHFQASEHIVLLK